MAENIKHIPCSCNNGIIDCPGCKDMNEKDKTKYTCAGCMGKEKVICGKCGGTGTLNDCEWNELTEQDKIDRTNGNDELPEGWTDWNKVPLDEMANLLENKYKFNSSSEAKCINELIRFYRAQKPPEKEYYTVWYFTEFGSSKTRCELSEIKDITRKFKVMSIEKEKK